MIIYRDYLNELNSFSISESAYDNNRNFILWRAYMKTIIEETFSSISLREQCWRAISNFCTPNGHYIIHKFKDYYAISRISNEFEPQEIDKEIQVFDEKRIYPLQRIKVELNWEY